MSKLDWLTQEIAGLKDQGLYNRIRTIGSAQGAWLVVDGKNVLNFCSNNYLGLANHPKIVEAAKEATAKYGVGPAAVRSIAGTTDLHVQLEQRLAKFKGAEDVITFQSGFTANLGTISALVGKEDVIFSDRLNHASIIDGCRLSGARIVAYEHNDPGALEDAIKENTSTYRRALVVTDGVFSMDGDIAPLPEIVALAEEFGAFVMVDDAHASGVLGKNGRGTVNHFRLDGRVALQIGTLSKGIGALGGYVACSKDVRDFLLQRARPVLFSTSHPPSVVATCIAALDILEEDTSLVERLWENTAYFKRGLEQLGFNTGHSETPITPVIVGEGALAMRFSNRLFEEGVFAQGIVYPTVPADKCRVRTIVTALHTREELTKALNIFERVGKELGII